MRDLKEFQRQNQIDDDTIILYFKLLKEKELSISNEQFIDFNKISNYLEDNYCKKKLRKYYRNHINDIDFIINIIISNQSTQKSDENNSSDLINDMMKILSDNINQCLQNVNFLKLPIQQIYNIINLNKEKINHDLLFNFINKNIDQNFVLFIFIDLIKLSNDCLNELLNDYQNSLNTPKQQYYHYLSCNLIIIKSLYEKIKNANKEYLQLKDENEQLQIVNKHHKENIQELNVIKEKIEQIQQNNEQIDIDNTNISNEINQINLKSQEFQKKLKDFTISDNEYNQGLNLLLPNKTAENSKLYFLYLCSSSKNGNSYASYLLGLCYLKGYKATKDHIKAFEYFQKSALLGNPNGTYYLGVCYEEGIGVSKDDKKAFEYYQISSELGNTDAKIKINIMSKK